MSTETAKFVGKYASKSEMYVNTDIRNSDTENIITNKL
jgi:hypothetical protein